MQEGYVEIGGIPTHIMTWGKWIDEPFEDLHEIERQEVIICIPGNPGLPGFYTKFCATLYESLNNKIPIWCIGHAGHDDPPLKENRNKVPDLNGNERLFDLKGQVEHKRAFIEKYLSSEVKIYLIGHSIGAYMNLELLKIPEIKSKVLKSYKLFPTVEKMASSPNGKLFTTFFPWAMQIAVWFYWLFSLLPQKIRIFIIYLYFMVLRIPNYFIGTALKYSKPRVVEKVIFLAIDEMNTVVDLDTDTIVENQDILKFYYGASDGWTPVEYCTQLQKRVPGIDAQICNRGIAHAFVLRSGPEMGYIVADWIKEMQTDRN